ncbi:uncharacterized protein RSE6_07964 [Rhynchosporium secalis]|uniref:Uncharacterized protein n=1 Tax=Rhynchosporium secalis TaxID=38038 RepID=A0A1E1MEB3_RHYSE|nr:uncharacterized protein RSE6_07964 [Rhynchosporium secalis]
MALEILDLHWLFMCSAMSMDTSTVDMIEFCLPACLSDNNIHINKSATNTTKYAYRNFKKNDIGMFEQGSQR